MTHYAIRKFYEKLYEKPVTNIIMEKLPVETFFELSKTSLRKFTDFVSYFILGVGEYKTYSDFQKAKKITYDYILGNTSNITIGRKRNEAMKEVIDFKNFYITPLAFGTMKGLGYYFLLNESGSNLFLLLSSIMILCPSLFEMYFDNKIKNVI